MGAAFPRLVSSQPQGPADTVASGIGDGLSGAWIPYTVAAPVNLVSGRPPTAIATAASASAGKVGGAFVTTSGGGQGYAYDNELLYPTDAVSVLALFETTGTVANNQRIAGSIHPTVSPFKGFGLDFSSSTNVRFNVSGSTFTSIKGAFVGNLSLVVGTYDRATMRLFVNGSQVASTAKTEAIQYNGTSFGLFRFTTALTTFHTTQGFPGKTYLVGMWRRALTLGEIQALTVNPWQIFRPYTARVYSFATAGGSIESGAGSSAGTSTAAAVGASTAAGAGSAAGAGTATGVGASTAEAVGTAAGTATASAVGDVAGGVQSGAGTSAGTSTAPGVGASTAEATGTSAGTSTATAEGAEVTDGVESGAGSAAGSSTAAGVGASTAAAQGTSAGSAAADATGAAIAAAAGTSAGSATASGVGSTASAETPTVLSGRVETLPNINGVVTTLKALTGTVQTTPALRGEVTTYADAA